MISTLKIEAAINSTHDQASFIRTLLIETLQWPLSEEAEKIEDISYEWSGTDKGQIRAILKPTLYHLLAMGNKMPQKIRSNEKGFHKLSNIRI